MVNAMMVMMMMSQDKRVRRGKIVSFEEYLDGRSIALYLLTLFEGW